MHGASYSTWNFCKKKWTLNYPDIPSAIRPVPHGNDLPVPVPPDQYIRDDEEYSQEISNEDVQNDSEFKPKSSTDKIHRISQDELSDLIRDLNLSKEKAELLASRLQQWNILEENVKVSIYRDRQQRFCPFFKKENNIVACCDINGLMTNLKMEYRPQHWRLFIDSSKLSLKAVLLHNGNALPSIPIGYAVHIKETYENCFLK